jgi:serine/threonine-protein kinase
VIGERYRIQALLGRGGMGVVYSAVHELTQRRVALKLVDEAGSDLPGVRERFLTEARTASAVRHPNVVDILDMGMHDDVPYLVMELLEGHPLDSVLEQGQRLSFEQILGWLLPVMGALVTLHEAGIVHRDIKPSNIFLSRGGRQALVPKLLDFGLARAVSDARLTRSGVVIGTPLYMAPEHAAGGHVGPTADVWSMGVVLYECVTGVLPFTTTDRSALAAQILAGHVRPVRQVRGDVPPALALAIDGALQRELGARHSSMRAFAQALTFAAAGCGVATPNDPDPVGLPEFAVWRASAESAPNVGLGATQELLPGSVAPPPSAPPRARRRTALLGVLLLLALAGALGLTIWLQRDSSRARLPAPPPPARPSVPAVAAPPPPSPALEPAAASPPRPAGVVPEAPLSTPERVPARPQGVERPAARERNPRSIRSAPAASPAEVETEWK